MPYVFNKNHNRTHVTGCRAVDMMNREKNEVPVDEPRGYICKWCNPGSSHGNGQTFEEDRRAGIEICTDPFIRDIFKKAGCLNGCGSLGDIKMFRDDESGVEIQGHDGKWWVYLECFECGYQTALWKAQQRLEIQSKKHERSQEPVRVV